MTTIRYRIVAIIAILTAIGFTINAIINFSHQKILMGTSNIVMIASMILMALINFRLAILDVKLKKLREDVEKEFEDRTIS